MCSQFRRSDPVVDEAEQNNQTGTTFAVASGTEQTAALSPVIGCENSTLGQPSADITVSVNS